MTRVNVGYPVQRLTTKHLIAEHREIKRIPNQVRKGRVRLDNIPGTFRLGTGHVTFFYNKLGYLLKRYKQIYKECIRRGFKVQNYEDCWQDIPPNLMGDYAPTKEDKQIIEDRIKEKLKII